MLDVLALKLAEVVGVVVLHEAVHQFYTDRDALYSALAHQLVFRNRRIRVSMSQLLLLEDRSRYLLIENVKRPGRYAPIGGVVRYFPRSADHLISEIGYRQQPLKSAAEEYDLRGFIEGAGFVPFIKWYFASRGREKFAINREIEEELAEIGAALEKRGPSIEYQLARSVHEGPSPLPGQDYYQYRHFEILGLEEQHSNSASLKADLLALGDGRNSKLRFASKEDILKGRFPTGEEIADSAAYLFSTKRIGREPTPFVSSP